MKKQILITFDYELFLGRRSGTVDNCLIKPTGLILDVLNKYNIRHAVFFVDTTYLLRLHAQNNENCKNDFGKIKTQLKEIIKNGHYVFPHLHPHWLDAKYLDDINQWDLSDISHYRLHTLNNPEIEKLFNDSIALIKEIQKEADSNYSIDCYRAGGWCLQPFSELKPIFEKQGIKHDFSVLRGFKNSNTNCFYDYSFTPEQNIYKFTTDVTTKEENGQFTEFSISSIEISNTTKLINRIYNKFLAYTGDINFGDGLSNDLSADKQVDANPNKEMISIELLTKPKEKAYRLFLKSNDYMHFISHPKMLSNHNIKTMDTFLREVRKTVNIETNYKNFIVN